MKHFIFIASESFTYQPNSSESKPDIENCQVIGFGKGFEAEDALKNLVENNPWILDTAFNHVTAYELKSEELTGNFWILDRY
jgi:hypothetical protein